MLPVTVSGLVPDIQGVVDVNVVTYGELFILTSLAITSIQESKLIEFLSLGFANLAGGGKLQSGYRYVLLANTFLHFSTSTS